MAKVTLIFAVLLVALGLIGFLGTGSQHPTALIPAGFGVLLGIFGKLAISPSERRRKLFMHINVTIGLLGFLGAMAEIVRSFVANSRAASVPSVSFSPMVGAALFSKLALALLLFIYVLLCVRSFIAARRAGTV